ncbi:glycosyltransferase [Luteibacter sp. CQ10]|uniref:glycosyltransferase n=1 Tax=Luteibacter sp. CQ10 TaxID=2805821 RepID=UPI0034A37FA8
MHSESCDVTQISLTSLTTDHVRLRLGTSFDELSSEAATLKKRIGKRRVVNIHTTAHGGGVSEILKANVPMLNTLGIETSWLLLSAPPVFFQVVKRLYHAVYGRPGGGIPLDESTRHLYEEVFHIALPKLMAHVREGDIVILHDPQTLGFAPALRELGAYVVWRLHLGTDTPNTETELARNFLGPYLDHVDASVVLCPEFAASWNFQMPVEAIPPSIDPRSAKNLMLDEEHVDALLDELAQQRPPEGSAATLAPDLFQRRYVLQVSRWDRAKGISGLLGEFSLLAKRPGSRDVDFIIAGPAPHAVADDPEGNEILAETFRIHTSLPMPIRDRVKVLLLPMDYPEHNAFLVNALQRRASVIVQNSSAEGFGLSVTEAMWKARPVVARRVGGIRCQIVDGESGILIAQDAPEGTLASAISSLLEDPCAAHALGQQARCRVEERFLPDTHLSRIISFLSRTVPA